MKLSDMNSTKTQNLFCQVGDILEVINTIETTPWPGEKAQIAKVGARYKAISLVEYGWDLKLIKGEGPEELRILNSEMCNHLKKM